MDAAINVDDYISNFPGDTQQPLKKVRVIIRKVIPEAEEVISYGIPTYKVDGKNIIHFGGYPKHIGFYPGSVGIEMFKDKLGDYKTSKGTIQFQLDEPIPYDLIKEITEACAEAQKK